MQLAGKNIEELRNTLLDFGPTLGQAKRKLVDVEKDIESLRKELAVLDHMKNRSTRMHYDTLITSYD